MLKTKSVYSPIERHQDGLRILTTRFRGRGLRSTRYDCWMANLGPSEKLLREFQGSVGRWRDFTKRYKLEILQDPPLDKGNETIKNHGQKFTLRLLKTLSKKGNVTIMCHCPEDQPHCHRHILRKLIESA